MTDLIATLALLIPGLVIVSAELVYLSQSKRIWWRKTAGVYRSYTHYELIEKNGEPK